MSVTSSADTGAGVYLTTNAATNSIFGNYIGTTADGAGSLGNRIGVFARTVRTITPSAAPAAGRGTS